MTNLENALRTNVSARPGKVYAFKNPAHLEKVTRYAFYIFILVLIISGISDLFQLQLLQKMASNGFADKDAMHTAAQMNDQRQQAIAVVMFASGIAATILRLMWIYRLGSNARALGAQEMLTSPGWAVGWFFVPFANLAMPLVALREIWKASASPSDWKNQPVPAALGVWWALFLVTSFVDKILGISSSAATSMDALQNITIYMMAAIPLDIIQVLLFLSLMSKMTASQLQHHQASVF
jgi:hypothetical protein